MTPISVCIITKNEEKNLDHCLSCISDYEFEIIVVDTGSTDSTLEIAARYTDKLFSFQWMDDFSAARNFSISKAGNDWILFLDSDEFAEPFELSALETFMKEHPLSIGRILRHSPDYNGVITTDRVERFFNRNNYHYERPIHEQVLPLHNTALSVADIPVTVIHCGYSESKESMEQKSLRNLKILEAALSQYPDSYSYYQIGQSYFTLGDFEKAAEFFSKGLSFDLSPTSEFVQLMVVNYGYSLIHLDRNQEALEFFERIYSYFSFFADFVFLSGLLYLNSGNYLKAALQFIQAVNLTEYKIEGTNSYLAYYNLGLVYEALGSKDLARQFYEKCGSYAPAAERLNII